MSSEKIVVGSAGTREGRAALDWALRRAERKGVGIEVVYVADADATQGRPEWIEAAASHGELVLERDAFLASTKAPHATVTTVVERGRPAERLAHHASPGSLMVLGAHDPRSLISAFFSPIIDTVALAQSPVVVVPVGTSMPRTEVIVGFGSSHNRGEALDVAAAEAAALHCTLVVVHAWSPLQLWIPGFVEPYPEQDDLDAATLRILDSAVEPYRRRYPHLRIETVAVNDLPSGALRARAKGATLLVLDPGRHGSVVGAMLGSVVRDLIMDPPCPTMVVPRPRVPTDATLSSEISTVTDSTADVVNRKVILSGAVASTEARDRAASDVARVRGVEYVDDRMTIDALSAAGSTPG